MEYWKFIRQKVGAARVIIPGVDVAIVENNKLLLVQSKDNSHWFLPGGLQELGETVFETGEREVKEELGIHIKATQLVSVYSGPNWVRRYANGDELQSLTFLVRADYSAAANNTIVIDPSEIMNVDWFALDNLPTNMHDYALAMTKDIQQFRGETFMR